MKKNIKFISACLLLVLGACTDYQGDYATANAAEVAAWKAASGSGSSGGADNGPAASAVDSRSGRQYETVKIGSNTWLAENVDVLLEGGLCYDNSETNCNIYGLLYPQSVALNACPDGFRLPSSTEWDTMLASFKDGSGTGLSFSDLMFGKSGYWPKKHTNTTGFTALPGGSAILPSTFKGMDEEALFWTSDANVYVKFSENEDGSTTGKAGFYSTKKSIAASVRCIK